MSGAVRLAKVRLSGPPEVVARLAAMIAALPAADVESQSAQYPNRAGGGVRVYLDVLVDGPAS